MNFKKVFLIASLFFCAEVTLAGTVTIKSPPSGLTLLTTSGVIKYGDEDLVLSTTEQQPYVGINISPEIEIAGKKEIIGMVSIGHRTSGSTLSNQNSCSINPRSNDYSVGVDNVGFKLETCKAGERKDNNQLMSEGVADVVVTFDKLP